MLDTNFIGIDVSSKNNVVHVMDSKGDKCRSASFDYSHTGSPEPVNRLINDPKSCDAYY